MRVLYACIQITIIDEVLPSELIMEGVKLRKAGRLRQLDDFLSMWGSLKMPEGISIKFFGQLCPSRSQRSSLRNR